MKRILKDLPEIIIAIILIIISRKDLTSTINIIGLYSGIIVLSIIFIVWVKNCSEAIIKK